MHIPPELILPQDMVDVTDLGPPDPGEPPVDDAENLNWQAKKAEHDAFMAGGSEPVLMRMHVSDAKHAMDVEPERYVLVSLQPKPEPETEAEKAADETEEDTGASGPAWYPPTQEKPVV